MSSSIKKFVLLRDALIKEKAELEARLAEIVAALGEDAVAAAPAPAKKKAGRKPGPKKKFAAKKSAAPKAAKGKKVGRRAGRRARSAVPLKETMVKAIGKAAMTRQEIAAAVEAAGYSSANVLNSVSATLYQNKAFKKDGKKWKLA
jgi:hypothetical protein